MLEMDEVYFPIMWREDGYRTPYIESHFAAGRPERGPGHPGAR